ncbi:8552_t:CDS:2, partial [Gigaspora margarita]
MNKKNPYWPKKHKAVELALCTSNSHAAQLYSLDLTIVDHWVKALSQAQLYKWIMMVHQNGLAVNYPNIKSKMVKILDDNWAKEEFRSENTDLAIIPGGLTNGGNSITKKGNLKHATFKKCDISNCLLESKDHLIYATNYESDEYKIEDFDNSKEEKFDEDNKDEEFDENKKFNEIKEFDKDDECDANKYDSDKSDDDEFNGDESNNRVSKWSEYFIIVKKLCK